MPCVNCGSYERLGPCGCTWDERLEAMRILRREQAEFRRQIGRPTVVEREREKRGIRPAVVFNYSVVTHFTRRLDMSLSEQVADLERKNKLLRTGWLNDLGILIELAAGNRAPDGETLRRAQECKARLERGGPE